MIKCFLPLFFAVAMSGALLSQSTYITGNEPVVIKSNTLFYTAQDFVLVAQADQSGVLTNAGKIRINGNFENANTTDGSNFINTWTAADNYGQVSINDEKTSTGKLTMQKQTIDPETFTWGQFAIPYQFSTVSEAFLTLFDLQYKTSGGRYGHSIMTWDNQTRPEYDHIAASTPINPTDYVLLNLVNHPHLISHMGDGTDVLNYVGTPANGTHSPIYRPAMYRDINVPWSTWKSQKNWYNERYDSYIEEHIRVQNSTHHGRYYFQFGNPYTSNIDLSYIGVAENDSYVQGLLGVVKITGTGWNPTSGIQSPQAIRAIWDGTQWGGDAEALIVKPFEGFYIGLKSDSSTTRGDRTFKFNDGLKTFSMTAADHENVVNQEVPVSSGRYFSGSDFQETNSEDKLVFNPSLTNVYGSRSSFYQLKLSLITEDGINTGNDVFIIVDSKSQTGIAQPLEAEYTDFNWGFFLSQENADGTEVMANRVMQINVVNPRYVAKPIQLFFKKITNDVNGYYLKGELFYKNIFSKLKPEDVNFIDGNSYFFYDKEMDVLLPVTADFSYYIERADQPQTDRYVVYWNGGPDSNFGRMDVSEEQVSLTQIYKDGDVHKIRFDKSWNSADIAVYDMAGRAIFKESGVKTQLDYTIELPKTMVYVIKIQSDTGETWTRKIVK